MRQTLWLVIGLGFVAGMVASPATARADAAQGGYRHALQIETQRQAFWRRHGVRTVRALMPEDQQRQKTYWQSQIRGHALCQAYGGCS